VELFFIFLKNKKVGTEGGIVALKIKFAL